MSSKRPSLINSIGILLSGIPGSLFGNMTIGTLPDAVKNHLSFP